MAAAGKTFITYDQTGRIYEALVTVSEREYLGQAGVATHELLHAIGLGPHRRVVVAHGTERGWHRPAVGRGRGVRAALLRDLSFAAGERRSFGILESGRE